MSAKKPDYDVIAIGAGFAGLAVIHYIREAGLSVKVFDRASDIGGTWTWNRYPGAATDSESFYYCLTFSKEILSLPFVLCPQLSIVSPSGIIIEIFLL